MLFKKYSLHQSGIFMIIGLAIQYVLGMAITFFVTFPESLTPAQYWDFSNHQILIVLHVLLALGLFVGAIVMLIRAIKEQNKMWKMVCRFGVIFIVIASIAGERFVSLQSDGYSFVMALAFIFAIVSYGCGVYLYKEKWLVVS